MTGWNLRRTKTKNKLNNRMDFKEVGFQNNRDVRIFI